MNYNWLKLADEMEKNLKSLWLNGKDTIATMSLQSIFHSIGVPENYAIKNLIKILESRGVILNMGVLWRIYPDKIQEKKEIKDLLKYDQMKPAGDVLKDADPS